MKKITFFIMLFTLLKLSKCTSINNNLGEIIGNDDPISDLELLEIE